MDVGDIYLDIYYYFLFKKIDLVNNILYVYTNMSANNQNIISEESVFYNTLLPTEIWFKIYKIEHTQNLKNVHNEIKKIYSEMNMAILGVEVFIKENPYSEIVEQIYNLIID